MGRMPAPFLTPIGCRDAADYGDGHVAVGTPFALMVGHPPHGNGTKLFVVVRAR
jgi:hypothetical protein